MVISDTLLDELERKAKESPRLRTNLCLHQSQLDNIQKMINVLLPGTEMHIHRHLKSDETLILLRGKIVIIYFDENGEESKRIHLKRQDNYAIDIPRGQWHNIIVSEPVALFEIKEGPYRALLENEIKQL